MVWAADESVAASVKLQELAVASTFSKEVLSERTLEFELVVRNNRDHLVENNVIKKAFKNFKICGLKFDALTVFSVFSLWFVLRTGPR